MKRANRRLHGKGGIELLEEATHCLRTAPAGALAIYYLGSVPFVLGLLYYWADMSRNPFAYQHLASGALAMTLLYLWMKYWHVVFARKLREAISGEPPAPWNFTRCRRTLIAQAVLQPAGLFLIPLAMILTFPFAWVYGFFQNVTALDDGEATQLRVLFTKARQQATVWTGQNHVALFVLSVFGFCVFISWGLVCYLLPSLGKSLLGIESMFTRSGTSLLNTTFFAAIFGLTYLSVDPIVKALYVLRCFYGESVKSGEDLKAELKAFSFGPVTAGLVLAYCLGATSIKAADPVPPPSVSPVATESSVSPPALDKAISEVIQQNKYTWRLPREKVVVPSNAETGVIGRFFERIAKMLKDTLRSFVEWLGNWLEKMFRRTRPPNVTGVDWRFLMKMFLCVLALAVGVALFFLLYRIVRNKRLKPSVIHSEAIQPTPDLTDENVGADQLPEDGWTRLARELLERGELRLALRAFYLASLAHLAERNLISLAKFKSNRDYERELQRRGHSFPNLLSVFGENISVFDRIWYGMHEVTRDLVQQFAANVDKIKGAA